MKTNIVLTGFMGSGKSTVGRLVALALQYPFVDCDDLVEGRAGKSIAQVFEDEGEQGFRALEREVCQQLALQDGLVIATGGGSLLDAGNRCVLGRKGVLVCLMASPQSIRRRLAHESGRPLFNGDWKALYEARQETYHSIPNRVLTDGKTPQDVAQEVVALWRASQ